MIRKIGKRSLTSRQIGLKHGFRSGLEEKVSQQLNNLKTPYLYEKVKLKFTQPEKQRTYTPDFILPNGIIIETKGQFTSDDRQKHLFVKEAHPHLDIRFVFSNPNARIRKGSPTTYAMWCDKNNFKYAAKLIPKDWINETPREYSSDYSPLFSNSS